MAKCQKHEDVERQFREIKEDISKQEAKNEILTSEVTIMKTQMQDIPKLFGIGASVLGVLQVLIFFAQWAISAMAKGHP